MRAETTHPITRLKRSIALTAALAVLLSVTASAAAARTTPGAHNALRGPGAVVQQQPQTWQSDGFGWANAFGVGVFLVVMGLALGYAFASTRSARDPLSSAARRTPGKLSPQHATRAGVGG